MFDISMSQGGRLLCKLHDHLRTEWQSGSILTFTLTYPLSPRTTSIVLET